MITGLAPAVVTRRDTAVGKWLPRFLCLFKGNNSTVRAPPESLPSYGWLHFLCRSELLRVHVYMAVDCLKDGVLQSGSPYLQMSRSVKTISNYLMLLV